MQSNLFQLPDPLPMGAVLVGPGDWYPGNQMEARQGRCFSRPELALEWLRQAPDGTDSPPSRLLLLHQDTFAGQGGGDRLVGWLEDVSALRGPFLPVLMHASLPKPSPSA